MNTELTLVTKGYGRIQEGGPLHILKPKAVGQAGTLPPALCGRRMQYETAFWNAPPEEHPEIVWCRPCQRTRAKEEEKR